MVVDNMPVNKYKELMGGLEEARNPAMDKSIQDAIIGTESSGQADAIGDVGAKAGDSRGLMQIQNETAKGLYKKGLLPKLWNNKKVKKRDLPDLLLDPEFNKLAGSALYEDNRNILKKKAIKEGIEIADKDLDDLTIKAHNQGVTRTIKRDLLNEEAVNPKVQQYLDKVKGRQAFADGGVPTEEPTELDSYSTMMADLKEREKKHEEDKRRAMLGDTLSKALSSVSEYGVESSAAKAQAGSGMQLEAPKYDLASTDLVKGLGAAPNLDEYLKKVKMMKELKDMKGKKPTPMTEYQKQTLLNKKDSAAYKKEQDILDNKYRNKVFEANQKNKKVGASESTDPKSEASITARKQAGFLTGREFPDSFTEAQISKMISPLARKIESGYQKKRLSQGEKRLGLAEIKTDLSKQRLQFNKDKHGYTVSEDDEKDALKYQEMATKHPAYKFSQSIRNDIKAASDVLERAKTGEATALKTLGVKLAKAFGEKGALSESDVTRYIQDPSVLGLIRSKGAEYKSAQITPEVYSSIKNILSDMNKNAETRLTASYMETAKKFSRSRKESSPVSLKKALFLVNPDYNPTDVSDIVGRDSVMLRRKSDGTMKRMSSDKAAKYLKDPNYEVAQ